jgi:hypothetical protein
MKVFLRILALFFVLILTFSCGYYKNLSEDEAKEIISTEMKDDITKINSIYFKNKQQFEIVVAYLLQNNYLIYEGQYDSGKFYLVTEKGKSDIAGHRITISNEDVQRLNAITQIGVLEII